MRKFFFNPATAIAAEIALFFLVKSWIGYPDDALQSLGFLIVFMYACNLVFLVWFLASPLLPRLWKIKRMEDDPMALYVMSISTAFMNTLSIAALLLICGANPGIITRLFATLTTLHIGLSTGPLYFPSLEARVRAFTGKLTKSA